MRDRIFYAICFGFLLGVLLRSFILVNFYLTIWLVGISFLLIFFYFYISKNRWGIIAGIFTTGSFIPQVYSVWSQIPKPAADVSLGMFLIFSLGVLFWFTYGCWLRSRPLIIFNTLSFVFSTSVLVYKLIFG